MRALRAHDERIDHWLNAKRIDQVRLLTDRIRDDRTGDEEPGLQLDIPFEFGDSFASMLLDHCGDGHLYATWGKRAAVICRQVEQRVTRLLSEHDESGEAFERFHRNLQRLIGEQQITPEAAAEMVAQHVVTIPIFDHVVTVEGFVDKNPLARALGSLLEVFRDHGHTFEEELRPLSRAYRSMERAFRGAASGAERLDVPREIYESFFKAAMPAVVQSLGIVYTPVKIVDFMLRSVDAVCRDQFGKGLTSPGVHVLDPFTGTGTFLNRLLTAKGANGRYLVRSEDLERKYGRAEEGGKGAPGEMHAALRAPGELHANEIVLLAYYIAALKIEEARHERKTELARDADGTGGESGAVWTTGRAYEPFGGMVLTDTFLMSEKQAGLQFSWTGLDEAGRRVQEQRKQRIRVIVGNPPWSAGKKAAGDASVVAEYPEIASRVSETYVRELKALGSRSGVKAAGNLFVKAFRWASDRLDEDDGIVCFVHPNSLADAPSLAGMRKALRDEFTDIHVVNLRGNAAARGAERKREGATVFEESKNGVQITLLVRNRERRTREFGRLHYAEVSDGCSLEQKFAWLEELSSVLAPGRFQDIAVNERHDWVNPGDPTWKRLAPVCSSSVSESDPGSVSHEDALGLATNLDAYVYSFSFLDLCDRVQALIAEFNRALEQWQEAGRPHRKSDEFKRIASSASLHAIKWTGRLESTLSKGEPLEFDSRRIREVLYRPFTKRWLYEDYRILSAGKRVSRMFPRSEAFDSLGRRRSSSTRHSNVPSESSQRPASSTSAQPDARPGSTPIAAILISGTNMIFQGIATTTLPDLATVKGSQQTRAIPRRRS